MVSAIFDAFIVILSKFKLDSALPALEECGQVLVPKAGEQLSCIWKWVYFHSFIAAYAKYETIADLKIKISYVGRYGNSKTNKQLNN